MNPLGVKSREFTQGNPIPTDSIEVTYPHLKDCNLSLLSHGRSPEMKWSSSVTCITRH